MEQSRILIAGGYGAVGVKIAKFLGLRPDVIPVIGGRNAQKAAQIAKEMNCEWIAIDLDNKDSITKGLENVDIVINCYIPSDDHPVILAEVCAEQQVNYLDLSAFHGYCDRVMQLDGLAREKGTTLITALGVYPGIPGLILADACEHFSKIKSADFYFVMGSKLAGITPLSMMGIQYMTNIPPQVWNGHQWQKPQESQRQEFISEPFCKKVFLSPGMITYDLHKASETVEVDKITYWSGMENLIQGLVFYIGLKLRLATTAKKAARFLKFVKYLAKGNKSHSEMVLKSVVKGEKDGKELKWSVEVRGTEDELTAIIPVLICDQIINGQIEQKGAFTGPQLVNTRILMESLQQVAPGMKEEWAPVK